MSVYGTVCSNLLPRGFSWQHGINHFVDKCPRHRTSALDGGPDLPKPPACMLKPPSIRWLTYPAASPHSAVSRRYRNIDLFPIGYAFRPRLRGRLTLSGLALLRNPWAYGERVFHPFFRYSCLDSHFCLVHQSLPSGFNLTQNALLPMANSEEFAIPRLRWCA